MPENNTREKSGSDKQKIVIENKKSHSSVAFQFIVIGALCIFAGFILNTTIVGAVIGIPLMIIGAFFILLGLLPIMAPLAIIILIIVLIAYAGR
jgi:predicted phage tail protein